MGVWQPDFQILLNCLILEYRFCSFSTFIEPAESCSTKDFEPPTLIGIRRAVLEYSFEIFTNLDKTKNGKADEIHFTVLCRWRDTRKLLP